MCKFTVEHNLRCFFDTFCAARRQPSSSQPTLAWHLMTALARKKNVKNHFTNALSPLLSSVLLCQTASFIPDDVLLSSPPMGWFWRLCRLWGLHLIQPCSPWLHLTHDDNQWGTTQCSELFRPTQRWEQKRCNWKHLHAAASVSSALIEIMLVRGSLLPNLCSNTMTMQRHDLLSVACPLKMHDVRNWFQKAWHARRQRHIKLMI